MTQPAAAPGYEIVVPGSTSNLGPAFDALSVAVDVALRLRIADIGVLPSKTADESLVLGGQVPATGENRILSAYKAAIAVFGELPPPVRATVESGIPMRAGLGS